MFINWSLNTLIEPVIGLSFNTFQFFSLMFSNNNSSWESTRL